MSVKKDTFYRCLKDEDGQIFASKTTGFSEGDIGVHKAGDFWFATHIPTGTKITPTLSTNKNRTAALKEAKKLISESPSFNDKVQEAKEGAAYKAFAQSKYAQECFTVI